VSELPPLPTNPNPNLLKLADEVYELLRAEGATFTKEQLTAWLAHELEGRPSMKRAFEIGRLPTVEEFLHENSLGQIVPIGEVIADARADGASAESIAKLQTLYEEVLAQVRERAETARRMVQVDGRVWRLEDPTKTAGPMRLRSMSTRGSRIERNQTTASRLVASKVDAQRRPARARGGCGGRAAACERSS
jgi:hypothetical protein